MTPPRIKILHIINSFEFGGAEAMLCNLLLRTDTDRFAPSVVSLIDDLTVAGPIINAGIVPAVMGMRPGVPDPRALARLARHLRRTKPDVIQTWMDHSNLIGGLAARAANAGPVVWGVHHSDHVPGLTKRSTLVTLAACAMLSRRLPTRIVFCSEHAAALYKDRGFAADRMDVIPNGFDTARFRPDDSARQGVRRELNIHAEAPLIGLVARYDPVKDHANFLQAAALLVKTNPAAHFLLCGAGVDTNNPALAKLVRSLGLDYCCHLLGPRRDVPRLTAALDVATSASISEAFPLAVGEAMACAVPCVATDVGDSALMIGDTGRTVPPSNPAALAEAWRQLLTLSAEARASLGQSARARVTHLFDLDAVTRRYESLHARLARRTNPTVKAA